MRTLPEGDGPGCRSDPNGAPSRRLVAVAVSAEDVLRSESDLRLVAGAATEVDVLVARVDRPAGTRRPRPFDAPDYPESPDSPEVLGRADGPGVGAVDDVLAGSTVPLPTGAHPANAGLPASLHLHRLDLRWRVQDADEPDLVAALSELIGFDPEDQVFCAAPAGVDPEEVAIGRAVARVARVYGLPVLHYRRGADGTGAAHVLRPEPAV